MKQLLEILKICASIDRKLKGKQQFVLRFPSVSFFNKRNGWKMKQLLKTLEMCVSIDRKSKITQ